MLRATLLLLCASSPVAGVFLGVPRLATDAAWLARRLGKMPLDLGDEGPAQPVEMVQVELGKDVELRDSPGKGKGVFALRDIPSGSLLTRYTGAVLSDDEYDARLNSGATSGDYALQLTEGWIVDGENPQRSNWVRYLNHNLRRQNCDGYEVPGAVVIVTRRDVKEGEELFFDYGPEYWASRVGRRFMPKRLIIDYGP